MGTQFKVVDASGTSGNQCFISKYTRGEGDDSWFSIGSSSTSWSRNYGWELVTFQTKTGARRGYYLPIEDGETCHITFHGLEREIEIVYSNGPTAEEIQDMQLAFGNPMVAMVARAARAAQKRSQ